MNLHEYQGKALFKSYGLPVPDGYLVKSVDEARDACHNLGGDQWVIKAQVHAGGRGKAGGVRPPSTVMQDPVTKLEASLAR